MVGDGPVHLLGYLDTDTVKALCQHSPWRRGNPTTAGQIRKGLVMIFHHVRVGDGGTVNAINSSRQTGKEKMILRKTGLTQRKTDKTGCSNAENPPDKSWSRGVLHSKLEF